MVYLFPFRRPFLLLSSLFFAAFLHAQTDLEIGGPCPDFTLKSIYRSPKKQLSLRDFKGKFFILDFWTTNCSACVRSFPKLNELQRQFQGKIDIVLVGRDELGMGALQTIRQTYEKFQQRYQLSLTSAFDTSVFDKFNVPGVPYLIWVNPEGNIAAITLSSSVDSVAIAAFISRQPIPVKDFSPRAEKRNEQLYNSEKPLLINNNGGADSSYSFRAILAPAAPGTTSILPYSINFTNRFQAVGAPLKVLYYYAYFVKGILQFGINSDSLYSQVANEIVFNTKDSCLFTFNIAKGINRFNCSIEFKNKKASTATYQKQLQMMLHNYFGLSARVEMRDMPCYRLIVKDSVKARLSRQQTPYTDSLRPAFLSYTPAGFHMIQRPADWIVRVIWAWHQDKPTFVDDTGIDFPIDFQLDAVMTELSDIRKGLQRNGFDLVPGHRRMQTLVISDAIPD